jgi:acyl-CoA synthetase (AMP-forming)/AMP-acid ligase II
MSIHSPFPDVEIPPVSLCDYLFGELATADCDRIAVVEAQSGASLRYGEMVHQIDAFAGGLAGRGIGSTDVVALLVPNCIGFVISFYGVLRAGAAATPINPLANAGDIAMQLRDSGARMLITVQTLLADAETAAATVGLSRAVVVLDGPGLGHGGVPQPNITDLLRGAPEAPAVHIDSASHIAVIPYSSGTTGHPKGVMLTHRNLVANIAQVHPLTATSSDDSLLGALPFFHSHMLGAFLNAGLFARARLVIMESCELKVLLSHIEAHKCTRTLLTPPILVALAKNSVVDAYDLSSLHTVMVGTAPMSRAIGEAVATRLGCRIMQIYGMTELSPASHMVPIDGGAHTVGVVARVDSCGWTLPNSQSKLIDTSTGKEMELPRAGLSAAGELCFKGPNVMAGYLTNTDATAEVIDEAGFLHTGDLARIDADGVLYIVGRLKEVIKYNGYEVVPAELESVLLAHPQIADVAVVGVADPQSGQEIPKAFVVPVTGARLSAADLMTFVARSVTAYKWIRQIEFVDSLPKSAAGKVLRTQLSASSCPRSRLARFDAAAH